ncbi:MAG TPA: hypothetical protein VFC00_22135 [Micromonosporaceae bacterium]|nr:hypothetical protein [Micromonosporaceae bacterium]
MVAPAILLSRVARQLAVLMGLPEVLTGAVGQQPLTLAAVLVIAMSNSPFGLHPTATEVGLLGGQPNLIMLLKPQDPARS